MWQAVIAYTRHMVSFTTENGSATAKYSRHVAPLFAGAQSVKNNDSPKLSQNHGRLDASKLSQIRFYVSCRGKASQGPCLA